MGRCGFCAFAIIILLYTFACKFRNFIKNKTQMKKTILFLFLLTVGLLPGKAENITVDGISRSYIAYAPSNLGEKRPLFIFCHGSGQDANYMLNTQFRDTQNPERKISIEAVCDTAKFVIVFPNGINNQWDISGNRDINFVKALIDKMETQYNIDRNRVYLGGFSMGGMFTYHAMNVIPDLIAAYVPVSGYPMGGATARADVRPLPILHIHGTGDDVCVFSGVQPALNVWINHNGCPTTAKTVNNYNGFNAKMHTWAPGNDGVEVKLLEIADKGHWVCKEPQVYTGKEMWNFCKKYSLNNTKPNISITSPKSGIRYIQYVPEDELQFPDITITANASDPNGTVEKVEFFDGDNLIATCTQKPYQATFSGGEKGKHTFKAVATDNDGETRTATVDMFFQAPKSLYLSSLFTEGGAVPVGWTTYDSSERRVGYSSGYSSGCRVLQFTGSPRGLDYGLYVRNTSGASRQGWAKYGLSNSGVTLTMAPGHYTLTYKICNWNRSDFAPVELNIEKRDGGQSVAKKSYTPTINIGNNASNAFKTLKQQTFEFDITEKGEYAISIYTDDSSWADFILGQLQLAVNNYSVTDIQSVQAKQPNFENDAVYDLQGRKVSNPRNGIFVKNGIKVSM